MGAVDQALALVGHWLGWLIAFLFGLYAAVEGFCRHLMDQLHIAEPIQTLIMVLVAVVFIALAFRTLGGVFRVLITVFLLLLLVHLLVGDAIRI